MLKGSETAYVPSSTPTRSSCPSNMWHCQPLSRFYRDPTPIPQTEREEEEKQRCQSLSRFCHLVQKSSCTPLPRHPIHTYETPPIPNQLQNTTAGRLERKARNVFATKGCMLAPGCTRASCTSPAQNVTIPGNVTLYRLLGVTLSRRPGGTI